MLFVVMFYLLLKCQLDKMSITKNGGGSPESMERGTHCNTKNFSGGICPIFPTVTHNRRNLVKDMSILSQFVQMLLLTTICIKVQV